MPDVHRLNPASRRHFLKTMGSLAITLPFWPGCASPAQERIDTVLEALPGSMRGAPKVNAWLEVLENGRVRIYSGKVELGQGIRNAIRQVAAEELYMDLDQVEVVLAETGLTPNEGYTAGSGSIQNSAMSVRYAAAAAREKLLELAAKKLQLGLEELRLNNGFITTKNGRNKLSFAEVLEGQQIEEDVPLTLKLKPKSEYQYVGKAISRTDLGKMVKGEPLYIHDLDFPDMVHARVLRPPNYKAELGHFDEAAFKNEAEGVLKVVRNGHFLAVITTGEYQAEKAVLLLEKHTQWSKPAIFPKQKDLPQYLKATAKEPDVTHGKEAIIDPATAKHALKANYFKPYTMHAAMGPTCAIGMYDGEILHIWSHSQGIYPMREGLATMLGMEAAKIHIISSPGSGAYGHTVADDAAADAAVLAMAYPGKHVRVRWSRADEHRWEPYGSAMLMELEAGVGDDGKLVFWRANIWTDSHSTRPNKEAGTLLTSRYLDPPFDMTSRGYLGGGHRNGDPYYDIPQMQVLAHYFDGPLRVSSLRSLGAFANIFAIESFMDELAEKSEQEALAFRLKHLQDQRAIEVIQEIQKMTASLSPGKEEGIGFAFCRYKNNAAYCAMAAQVHVDLTQKTVKLLKMWVAIDVGEVINLDGIKNQVEGGVLQAAAWTLKEEVTFDEYEITSIDWVSYEIQRFKDAPAIEVAVIDRPNEAAMGGGEVSTPPVAAAICNAIYRACGQRVYALPVRLA
ncbi:MAG: molybdopterin cofactor-binding domain-containing protein [Saprospiraceae bacterium]